MSKVIFEFDYEEEHDKIVKIVNVEDAYIKLCDIYNAVRTRLKHPCEGQKSEEDFLHEILEIAYID